MLGGHSDSDGSLQAGRQPKAANSPSTCITLFKHHTPLFKHCIAYFDGLLLENSNKLQFLKGGLDFREKERETLKERGDGGLAVRGVEALGLVVQQGGESPGGCKDRGSSWAAASVAAAACAAALVAEIGFSSPRAK